VNFSLEEEQWGKVAEWRKEREIPARYAGAIGGSYSYIFTPTSIGLVIQVRDKHTEEVLDVSDYRSW